jgi:CheY-like chemotaxis protein
MLNAGVAMKRQERNSRNLLARIAASTLHTLTYTIPTFSLRTIDVMTLYVREWTHKSKNNNEWNRLLVPPPTVQGSGYHVTNDEPNQEREALFMREPTSSQDASYLHVALVDDNTAILDFLETALAIDGHTSVRYLEGQSLLDEVLPASAESAIEFVPPYDLVILDLLLPGRLSGADVFVAIRKRLSAEQLPIIVITAVDELTLEQFRRILPDDVPLLRKPFPPRILRSLIIQLLGLA